jgi:uncharacterized membrane protein YfcA
LEFSAEAALLLFFVAMIAGWVDSIAGGGGLLTVPAMLLVGMPPAMALATNKLQSSAGTLTAAVYFINKGAVNLGLIKWLILATFLGSMFGSWLVLQIDAEVLLAYLPILLILVGLYFLFSPNIGDEERKRKLSLIAFAVVICPLLGFYDGFIGPGTGSFMALSFVLLCGYGLSRATANAKVLNFTSNISALLYFMVFGEVFWLMGLVMIAGQLIGAFFGAKMALEKGSALIRPIVVIVCFVMSANILFKQFA